MKASPTVIGAFTLGAVVLALGGLVALRGGELFARPMRAVVFFTDDLQGLTIGSPVDFRGVKIGKVSAIKIRFDPATRTTVVPVYITFTGQFDSGDRNGETNGGAYRLARDKRLRMAVDNGLHARLATQSLVTGERIVELDFDPTAPRHFVGADPTTIEIPTSPSDIEKIRSALARLPIDKIGQAALRLLNDADRVVGSPEAIGLLRSLLASSDSFGRLMDSTQAELGPLIANVNETVTTARTTLVVAQGAFRQARTTFATGDHVMSTDLRRTLGTATSALEKAEKALTDVDGLVAANSPQRYDLDQSLQNLSKTSQALRHFSENLEHRPNSILLGN